MFEKQFNTNNLKNQTNKDNNKREGGLKSRTIQNVLRDNLFILKVHCRG